MDPRNLREFACRPRAEVEVEKLVHWVRVFREGGPAATLAAGHALYEHARSVRPDFPTDRDIALDLEHLLVLKDRIDRASRALAVR